MNPAGRWLHRVLGRHPRARAELYNQYRASEDFARRYPRSIVTELLPEGPLREKYRKHQADEERHERLYAARVEALGCAPLPVDDARDYMAAVWREACAAGVGLSYTRLTSRTPLSAEEQRRLFALQVAMEERGLEEIALQRAAGPDEETRALLDAVEPDERHHAAYSRRALADAVADLRAEPPELAQVEHAVLGAARRAEERAYDRVTGAFLGALLAGPLSRATWSERAGVQAIRAALWAVTPAAPPAGDWQAP